MNIGNRKLQGGGRAKSEKDKLIDEILKLQ